VSYKKDESGEEILTKDGKKHIEHKRYSEDKFLFHVPITLNFCQKNTNINTDIQSLINHTENLRYLGIDRGEKHLLYYSLIDEA